jgi:hypothetical protein
MARLLPHGEKESCIFRDSGGSFKFPDAEGKFSMIVE